MVREAKEDDGMDFLETEAFVICDEDNDDGLTWKEVSDCIVSHFIYLRVTIYQACYLFKKKHTSQFQESLA